MPETDENKTVDIDTSGPEVEVALPETQQEEQTPVEDKQTYEKKKDHGTDISYENERETKLEDGGSADDSSEKSVQQSDGKENNKQEDNSKQIEEYSEGVKKRIAKLTKIMLEA